MGDDLTYTETRHEAFERFAKERSRADRQDFSPGSWARAMIFAV
jgi:hypothetical protein